VAVTLSAWRHRADRAVAGEGVAEAEAGPNKTLATRRSYVYVCVCASPLPLPPLPPPPSLVVLSASLICILNVDAPT